MELPWPGNVRQLQNFIEKRVILCEEGYQDLVFEELYAGLLKYSRMRDREAAPDWSGVSAHVPTGSTEEAAAIRKAFLESRFSKTQATKRLGISRTTLWRKLREMGTNVCHPGSTG